MDVEKISVAAAEKVKGVMGFQVFRDIGSLKAVLW